MIMIPPWVKGNGCTIKGANSDRTVDLPSEKGSALKEVEPVQKGLGVQRNKQESTKNGLPCKTMTKNCHISMKFP